MGSTLGPLGISERKDQDPEAGNGCVEGLLRSSARERDAQIPLSLCAYKAGTDFPLQPRLHKQSDK